MNAASRIANQKRFPRMPDRIQVERALEKLSERGKGTARYIEPWKSFLSRIDIDQPDILRSRDMKRLVSEIWADESLAHKIPHVISSCSKRQRKSSDRALILSYLYRLPVEHPAFGQLRTACAAAAANRDWAWRERGIQWTLWNEAEGPIKLGKALTDSDDPSALLRDAGLDGDLATGAFAQASLLEAMRQSAQQKGTLAEFAGERLLLLADRIPLGSLKGVLAHALLTPWTDANCNKDYRFKIQGFLTKQLGDPRMSRASWANHATQARLAWPEAEIEASYAVLRRWLVESSVRDFFDIIDKSTDRPDQWRDRKKFWLAYLDAGAITDAWFALGSIARNQISRMPGGAAVVPHARVEGAGATSSQSALLMKIGDLTIAEWSDNGRSRFWAEEANAMPLYRSSYDGMSLRVMASGSGFAAIAHQGSWEGKFARHIYRMTGIRHPKLGMGS